MKHILISLIALIAATIPAVAQNEEWKLIHEGNRHFNQKNYNTARRYYEEAHKINNNNPRALFNLGNTNMAIGNDSIAITQYDQFIQRENDARLRSLGYHNKGVLLQRRAGAAPRQDMQQELLRAAIKEYQSALRENPENDPARYNMVLCQKQLLKNSNGNNGNSQQEQQPQQQQQNPRLMNYARQAEKRTRDKINQNNQRRQRGLEKNW